MAKYLSPVSYFWKRALNFHVLNAPKIVVALTSKRPINWYRRNCAMNFYSPEFAVQFASPYCQLILCHQCGLKLLHLHINCQLACCRKYGSGYKIITFADKVCYCSGTQPLGQKGTVEAAGPFLCSNWDFNFYRF